MSGKAHTGEGSAREASAGGGRTGEAGTGEARPGVGRRSRLVVLGQGEAELPP